MGNCSSNEPAPQSKALSRHHAKEEQMRTRLEEDKRRAEEEEAQLKKASSFRVAGSQVTPPSGFGGAQSGKFKWARRASQAASPPAGEEPARRHSAPMINGSEVKPLVPCDQAFSGSDEKIAFNGTGRTSPHRAKGGEKAALNETNPRTSPHRSPRHTPVSPWSTGVRPVGELTPKEDDWPQDFPKETAKSPLRSIASSNNDSIGPADLADGEVEEQNNTFTQRMARQFPPLRKRAGSAPDVTPILQSSFRQRSGSVPANVVRVLSPRAPSDTPSLASSRRPSESPSLASSRRRSLQYPVPRGSARGLPASDFGDTDICSAASVAPSGSPTSTRGGGGGGGPRVGPLRKNPVFARPPCFPGVVGKPTAVTL